MNNAAGRLYGKSALRETLPILGKILVVVLMCEAVVTVILYLLLPLSLWHVIIDPIFLGVLMTPQVYRFVVKPIRRAAEQRKLAEEARLLEQKYESLIRNIPVAVYSAMPDERGTTTFMADRWKEWTGYSPEDLYRDCSTWPRSIHPDDKNKAIESYIKAWKERREYVSEYRVVHKDTGEVRYLRDHGVPIKDETGNIIRIEGIAIDITERVRAEEEIKDLARFPSEDPAPVLRIAADGTVLYANKTAEPLLAAKGSGANQAAPPEWRELVASVLVSGTRQVTEVEHGEQVFAVSVVPLPEAGYVNLYGADVTERKRAEYLLKNFTEGLLGNVPAIVITLDNQLRVKQFNKFAEELTGYTEKEVLGKTWFDMFIAPEEKQHIMDAARKGFTGKALSGFENHILAKDGHKILMQWYASSLRDDRGNIVGTLGIGIDVTELRQKEEQLRQSAKMEAIGRLAGGVAHDFNNYLAAITGYTALVLEDLSPTDTCRNDLEQIAKAAESAAQLTKQLLAFGRKAIVRRLVVNLNSIINEMANPLEHLLGENITLEIREASDLGNVQADPGQVQQIVMNLAVNARDAMPRGGTLTIETANVALDAAYAQEHPDASTGAHIMLAATDNGIGIDKGSLEHIFEPFFTTKRTGEGAGLGLATVHGIVTQDGGHITVESRPGEGTTFRCCFPRVEIAEEAGRRPPARPAPSAGAETILVVEDERAVRNFLVKALELSGYAVLSAGSPEEALGIVREFEKPIHLLVCDVIMPEMSGPELAEKLAETHPEVPVLYISGYTRDAIPDRSIAEADIELLAKPFSPDELRDKVRQTLDAVAAKG